VANTIKTILDTCNPPAGAHLNWFAKWLVIIRACVFSMTVFSPLIAILLAWRTGQTDWIRALLVILGLLLAHAANNVLNDLMDYRSGVDTPDYYRVKYSFHPLTSGWVTQRQLFGAFLLFSLLDLGLLLYFISLRGWGVAVYALAGFFISAVYVGGRYSLKHLGLGEIAVFFVWGPLMVGGTYFVIAGSVPWKVYLASIPYALMVTTILMAKHIDKLEKDREKKIHTLPVILGHSRAMAVVKGLIVLFYVAVVAGAITNMLPLAALLVFFSIPRARSVWRLLSQPRPTSPPANWPIWPLWYVGYCFHLIRLAGALLLGGMFGQILIERLWLG